MSSCLQTFFEANASSASRITSMSLLYLFCLSTLSLEFSVIQEPDPVKFLENHFSRYRHYCADISSKRYSGKNPPKTMPNRGTKTYLYVNADHYYAKTAFTVAGNGEAKERTKLAESWYYDGNKLKRYLFKDSENNPVAILYC